MSRWIRFIIAIAVGLALALFYGWVLSPVEYVDTAPITLRDDYQADYVLMIAEIYQSEHDLLLAEQRLTLLSSLPAENTIQGAIDYAELQGYIPADIDLLRRLYDVVQVTGPVPEGTP